MTQSAPKRYAHTLIKHFIIIALFMPAFFSKYGNAYYQDLFLTGIIAFLVAINIFSKWTLNFKRNLGCVIGLTVCLILYNAVSFYNYSHHTDLLYWKSYQLNVSVAFVFFIALLTARDHQSIVTDKVIKLAIYTIILNNLVGFYFRAQGYSSIHMTNLTYTKNPLNPTTNNAFSWLYYDASEYALILLLCMAFFMVYKDHFRNIWTYILSQVILLIGLCLTKSGTFLLAAAILFGCQLVHYLLTRFQVKQKYILLSLPIVLVLGGIIFYYLFTHVDSFITKYHIWKGNWELLMTDTQGLRTAFGPLKYEVENVSIPLNQAHNVFLNHMLRYSLPVGTLYTIMFLIIIICSFVRNPNYLSLGIWIALLIPMNMDYALQTLNLPFMLFMIYCIFFRKDAKKGEPTNAEQIHPEENWECLD